MLHTLKGIIPMVRAITVQENPDGCLKAVGSTLFSVSVLSKLYSTGFCQTQSMAAVRKT